MLSTYLYKLTNKLGVPSYQLMAVVVVVIIAITAPLVFMQRLLLRQAQRYVSVRGKGLKTQPLRLHGWRWLAFGAIVFWLFITVVVPLFGITLRSFVVTQGEGREASRRSDTRSLSRTCRLSECDLRHPEHTWHRRDRRMGGCGGCYTAIALAVHR